MLPRPSHEAERLAALRRLHILDTPADEDFDFLTRMAAEICRTPYAFISLVDEDRVWIKSHFGRDATQAPRDDDYCSLAILGGLLYEVPDLTQDPLTRQITFTREAPYYRMYSSACLMTSDGHALGTLCVLDTRPRQLSAHQKQMLASLAKQVVSLIELRALRDELRLALTEVERLAEMDELTGLANRRVLMRRLLDETVRTDRYDHPLALVMLDIDHFKQVNDRHGHAAGDAVLGGLGTLLATHVRKCDVAARLGGEEFCLLLPETTADQALLVADKLRHAFASRVWVHDGVPLRATLSAGVAATDLGLVVEPDALLQAADVALYQAKANGRDRVQLAAEYGLH